MKINWRQEEAAGNKGIFDFFYKNKYILGLLKTLPKSIQNLFIIIRVKYLNAPEESGEASPQKKWRPKPPPSMAVAGEKLHIFCCTDQVIT